MAEEGLGILYICGTPIGNLADVSRRLEKTLASVDLIACEDTRRTAKLLHHLGIKNALESLHEHNEEEKCSYILKLLAEGKNVALVSDAGMPVISDPGAYLVEKAIEAGAEVIPIPGPTALIQALVSSGLPSVPFTFEGFLPKRKSDRQAKLKDLIREKRTMIFYETPHRLTAALRDMAAILGPRKACVVRELTKKHEEKIRGTLEELAAHFEEIPPRGEFVIVVAGADIAEEEVPWDGLSILEHLRLMMDAGFSKKEAIKKIARERGIPKRRVYQEAIKIDARKNN